MANQEMSEFPSERERIELEKEKEFKAVENLVRSFRLKLDSGQLTERQIKDIKDVSQEFIDKCRKFDF